MKARRTPGPYRPAACAALSLAVLVIAVAPAGAVFNASHDYEAVVAFGTGIGEGNLTIVSGQGSVDARGTDAGIAVIGTTGFEIAGLGRACWGTLPVCETGNLTLDIRSGSAVGLYIPGPVQATLVADHMLATFQDFGDEEAVATSGFGVDQAILASAVGGNATLVLPVIPPGTVLDDVAGIVNLDGRSIIEVVRDGVTLARIDTAREPVYFSGAPVAGRIVGDAYILPFASGSTAALVPAGPEAAAAGLDLEHILAAWERMSGARPESAPEIGAFSGFLDGALLTMPGAGSGPEGFVLVRYQSLDLVGGTDVHVSAVAPLVMEEGHVRGAEALIGIGYIALPLWSILLWCLALGIMVARVAARSPKKNERWDPYRWIGLVSGGAAFLLVAWLWDREVHAVLGVSALSGPGEIPLGILVLVQFGFLGLILFATAAPLRTLIRNGLMLARQGTFMGLAAPVATIAGFLIGVTLLPSYLEHVLQRVLEQVA